MFGESAEEHLHSVGLLPHQVEFVDEVVNATRPARFLLIAPPGLGKSQAIIAAIGKLTSQSTTPTRSLVIVPSALQADWAELLERVLGMKPLVVDAPAYRRLQAETPSDQNPWDAHQCIVTSIDFLKKGERAMQALSVPWDVVVLHEVHEWPARSWRRTAATRIWHADLVSLGIATTTSTDEVHWEATARVYRWTYGHLRGRDGAPISPRRDTLVTTYQLSASELRFDNEFERFLADPAIAKVSRILLARRHSSIYAVEQSLRRRLAQIEYFNDYTRPSEGLEIEELSDEALDVLALILETQSRDEGSQQLLGLLEQISHDSKWAACEDVLRSLGVGEESSLVVFTEFADTAEYVGSLAESSGWRAHLITRAISVADRLEVLQEARSEPGVLIITTGAIEGLNLDVSDHVLHYDVPRQPEALLRRYGIVEYSSGRFPTIHHHFLVEDDPAAESVLESMQARVAEIERMFWRR